MTDTERKTPTDSAMTAEQIDDSYIPSIVSRLRGPQDQYGTPASSTDLAIATLIERLTTERTKLAADLARVTEDRDRLVKKYDYVVSVAAGMEQRALAAEARLATVQANYDAMKAHNQELFGKTVELEARLAQANEALTKIANSDGKWVCEAGDARRPNYIGSLRDVARAALSPTPPAQSAGEALDPAGTGEGKIDLGERARRIIDELFAQSKSRLSEGVPFAEMLEVRAGIVIRAQASALAEAREALRVEAELADKALDAACGLASAGVGLDDKNHTFPLKEIRRRLSGFIPSCGEVFDWTYPIRRARAAAKDPNHPDNKRRALTEPQHGNG